MPAWHHVTSAFHEISKHLPPILSLRSTYLYCSWIKRALANVKVKKSFLQKKTKNFIGWFNSQQCSDDFLKVSWSYLQSVVRYEQECIAADHPIPNTGVHGNACIFWPRFFLDLKFSGIVPNNIFYHFWRFEQNRSRSFWEMVEKPSKNAHIRNYWRIQIFFG